MSKSFVDLCLAGEVLVDEIDDFVDRWHDSDSDLELSEYLGMTDIEYKTWVERPNAINCILFAKKRKLPLDQALLVHKSEFQLATRASELVDTDELIEWLRKTGRINE